jgi:hypothetical protein
MTRKLGKLSPKIDPRTLRLARYLRPDLPPAPAAVEYGQGVSAWGMMQNDVLGCCTCASAGHMVMAWTSNAGAPAVPGDDAIVQAYSAVSGYNPATGERDNGAIELDVLRYWRKQGIAGHKIAAYAAITPYKLSQIKAAIWLFEGAYLGLALPETAQDQEVWDLVGGPGSSPGSWGGHAVNAIGYDEDGVTVVTWGAKQRMTWSFWGSYCDEAYAVLSEDMLLGDGRCCAGMDLPALQRDLLEVSR